MKNTYEAVVARLTSVYTSLRKGRSRTSLNTILVQQKPAVNGLEVFKLIVRLFGLRLCLGYIMSIGSSGNN